MTEPETAGREFPVLRHQRDTDAVADMGSAHTDRKKACHGWSRAGPWLVQLLLACGLPSEEYVRQKVWLVASMKTCPLHPNGGCGFARHTAYTRVSPPGCKVARFYCPVGHTTFSLLPDCLCSRLSGSLQSVEDVVAAVEAAKSVEAAASTLRPEIELPGAIRWVRRRLKAVNGTLATAVGLLPKPLAGCALTVTSCRLHLKTAAALLLLRAMAGDHLGRLPPPLGFGPRPERRWVRRPASQQETGPDPPGRSP